MKINNLSEAASKILDFFLGTLIFVILFSYSGAPKYLYSTSYSDTYFMGFPSPVILVDVPTNFAQRRREELQPNSPPLYTTYDVYESNTKGIQWPFYLSLGLNLASYIAIIKIISLVRKRLI